ncbi:MAG: hypothetical protein ACK5LK_10215 [Chthoniobacterales bacterium]
MDCTFCLDCVRACPHDNVGWIAASPSDDLLASASDAQKSGIGRLSKRPDLVLLCVVLVFAAYVNAAGMISPVLALEDRFLGVIGAAFRPVLVAAFVLLGCLVLPLFLLLVTSWISFGQDEDFRQKALAFACGLVPLGLGMWAAHFSFHFLTGLGTIIPVVERFFGKVSETVWQPPVPLLEWLLPMELIFLNIGFIASAVGVWRLANYFCRLDDDLHFWRLVLPWLLLLGGLFYLAVWIVFQPMEMRGTLLH